MTVGELIVLLQQQDDKKRVVVADRDGAGTADDVEFVDQRREKGEDVVAVWYHR